MDTNGNPQVFTSTLQPNTPDPVNQPMPGPGQLDFQIPPWEMAQRQQLIQRIATRPMVTATPEQIRARKAVNDLDTQFGQLMMLTGDAGAQELGGSVLKQAMAMRTPQITERGMASPMTGEFTYDPDYLNRQDQATLASLDQHISNQYENYQRDLRDQRFRADENQRNRDARKTDAEIIAGNTPQAVIGPNGQPIFVSRPNAIGKMPVPQGGSGNKTPAEIQRMQMGFQSLKSTLDQYEEALKTYDPRDPNALSDPAMRAKLNGLDARLTFTGKEAASLGALTGGDFSLWHSLLTSPVSLQAFSYGREGLLQQIQQARAWIAAQEEAARAVGYNPGTPANQGVDMSHLTPSAIPNAVAASGPRR